MAIGIPSLFPDSLPTDDSLGSCQKEAPDAPLTEDEITAILEFFLLLDKWDRQKKAA